MVTPKPSVNHQKEPLEETTPELVAVLDGDFAEVSTIYQNDFGSPSKTISDTLFDLMETYGKQWLVDAMQIAVKNEARKLSYVEGILRKWHTNGRSGGGKTQNAPITSDETGGMYV